MLASQVLLFLVSVVRLEIPRILPHNFCKLYALQIALLDHMALHKVPSLYMVLIAAAAYFLQFLPDKMLNLVFNLCKI